MSTEKDDVFIKTCGEFINEFLSNMSVEPDDEKIFNDLLTSLLVTYFRPLVVGNGVQKIGLKKSVLNSLTNKSTKANASSASCSASAKTHRPLNGYNLYVKVAKYANTHSETAPLDLGMPDYAAQWKQLESQQKDQFNTVVKSHSVIVDENLNELSEDDLNKLLDNVTLFKNQKVHAFNYNMFTKIRSVMKSHKLPVDKKWADMSEDERKSFFDDNSQYWDQWLTDNPEKAKEYLSA